MHKRQVLFKEPICKSGLVCAACSCAVRAVVVQWCIEKEGERERVRMTCEVWRGDRMCREGREGRGKREIVMECGEYITLWLLIIQSEMTHKAFLSISIESRML